VTHRKDGSPLFTPQQFKTVSEAGIDYFRDKTEPYAAGILIPDPRYSEENVEGIIRLARRMDPTLTEEHAAALRKIYSGPSIGGKRICGGAPFGVDLTELSRRHLWFMEWYFGENFDPLKLDFERDFMAFEAAMGPLANADNPDLDAFRKRGGKLLLCTGTEDEAIPFHMSMAYYEQVIKRYGSLAETQKFCRYIVLPGRMHNGARAERGVTDYRDFSIEQWREKDIVPDSVTGICRNGEKIPVYFYPQMTAGDFPDHFHPVERERGTGYENQ
jgi:feruloyl esterase